ncbi:MAG: hypothetical protein HKP48_07080 [Winogradskyella sp.]|uniref:hypothetical protein n=1 Tax=Winogradskyella sp. TaxID=1883156 RepID=UPI0017FE9F27|nr:hypothetical protein [Winogradskyella sp.]MBT8245257.1 hypothetical protein [Winogradskyella sp.]NNK23046.1 hypothetical protein [Winogradskyella sp.]
MNSNNLYFKCLKQISFIFFIAIWLSPAALISQVDDSPIIENFEDYTEAPRKNIYIHLNKTTYVKGEMIGFKAYVFDKASKELSFSTTNLYCTITDKNNKTVRSGLFIVKKGVTSNVFETHSLFTSGNYAFRAYTNWILNFKEKIFFSQKIRIIDPDVEKQEKAPINEITKLDIQALPEGGHLLKDVPNTFGIVIKDQFGKGIPNIQGAIVDVNNTNIGTFILNELDVGRTPFMPTANQEYSIAFNFGYKDYKQPIVKAKKNGISISLKDVNDKVVLSILTNDNTLQNILDENYILALHNGAEIEAWEFNFSKDNKTLNKVFEKDDLYPSINIFTLFNSKNSPLQERLFFNNIGIEQSSSIASVKKTVKDSLDISITIPNLQAEKFTTISVSILPTETKSYTPKHNILSSTFLKPYLKEITTKKLYELDNLMISQGWSSYNWGNIFSNTPETAYSFEQGISYKASINNRKDTRFLIQPLKNSKSVFFDVTKENSSFQGASLLPTENDQLNITEINSKNHKTQKSQLYFTFKPASIPEFNNNLNANNTSGRRAVLTDITEDNTNLNEIQKLEEVQLSVKLEKTRYESLKKLTRGSLIVFDDMMRNAFTNFSTFIASKGFIVNENLGQPAAENGERLPLLTIYNARKNRLTGSLDSPLIFINDLPLKFQSKKSYYIPKYKYFNTDFFNKYETIGLSSNLTTNLNGEFKIRLFDTDRKDLKILSKASPIITSLSPKQKNKS